MVLNPTLTAEQVARHHRLIQAYFREVQHLEPVIEFYANGAEKGVYKVRTNEHEYLAAAATMRPERRLLTEYLPRPIAHYSPEDLDELGDLMVMEFLPHQNIDVFDRSTYPKRGQFFRDLAKEIGKGVAFVHAKTGRYPSEPHNGNVLVRVNDQGDLDLRFCDAIQFRTGTIEDAVRAVLINRNERGECFRFINHFRQGLAEGVSQTEGIPEAEALPRFNFLREYNPIF